jgi:short-subunit dehydrogenase
MQKIVIIGASSAIAEHCARLWARQPVSLVLVGRELARVQRIADDLRVRSPQSQVQTLQTDFGDPAAIGELARRIAAEGRMDIVLIAHGNLPDQQACERDLLAAQEALLVNGVSPVLFAEAFAGVMQATGGTIAVIGSVAGDRGRKSNYAYGAAKGLVDRYVQGMQHRFARGPLKLVLVKPGPTATPMTAHLPPRGLAPVDLVAQRIVDGIAADRPVVYAPAKWWLIMIVIRHLPRFVFNRMDI